MVYTLVKEIDVDYYKRLGILMNLGVVIDSIMLAVCVIFIIQGFFRGFVYEVVSLLAFVAGYFAVVIFKDKAISFLENTFHISGLLSLVLASIFLFVIAYVLVKFLEVYLSRFINIILLSGLNKIAGMLVGFFKGAVVVLLIVYLIRKQPIFPNLAENLQIDASAILPYLELFGLWLMSFHV